MTTIIPIERFGEAAPFERRLRKIGDDLVLPILTSTPQTADAVIAQTSLPSRVVVQVLAALARSGAVVYSEGWALNV